MHNIFPTKLSYIIEIPKIRDEGYLSFAEESRSIPFEIKRIYYIYGVEKNAIRGKHAHKKTQQILFCISGSVKIVLDNGSERESVVLREPNHGIILDRMMWHEMTEFSDDAILLTLASEYYDENDYIRSYRAFIKAIMKHHKKRTLFNVFFQTVRLIR